MTYETQITNPASVPMPSECNAPPAPPPADVPSAPYLPSSYLDACVMVDDLREALKALRPICAVPDYNFAHTIMLKGADGRLTLTARDGTQEAHISIRATIAQEGTVIIDATMLHRMMQKAPKKARVVLRAMLTLSADDESAPRPQLRVNASNAEHHIDCLFGIECDRDDIPQSHCDIRMFASRISEDAPIVASVRVNATLLKRLLRHTIGSVGEDDTRPYLNGVHLKFETHDDDTTRLTAAASTGTILSYLDAPCAIKDETPPAVTIPADNSQDTS